MDEPFDRFSEDPLVLVEEEHHCQCSECMVVASLPTSCSTGNYTQHKQHYVLKKVSIKATWGAMQCLIAVDTRVRWDHPTCGKARASVTHQLRRIMCSGPCNIKLDFFYVYLASSYGLYSLHASPIWLIFQKIYSYYPNPKSRTLSGSFNVQTHKLMCCWMWY